MNANGLRLLLAARKSRKGDTTEDDRYTRQEHRAADRVERDGHAIVETVRDTVSSQSLPWERRNLKKWMTDPAKLALWDALYVTETDRLARMDDKGFHDIESWCYEHGKKILTAEGVMFPPRDDSDRYQWLSLKRRARTYWEDVADKHAATREVIRANGAAIGLAPFGYKIEGPKLHKQFVIDPVNGPLAREAFQRIADGKTATSVAEWLTGVTGKLWRVKRVTDMIQRRTYLGERDGHVFEALVSKTLFDDANAALASRSFKHGGRKIEHGYSGLVFCECGAQYYHHQSTRDGKPVGQAKYRCGRGRQGDVTEKRCGNGAPMFDAVNDAVDVLMRRVTVPERITVTTGGDHGRQMELARIKDEMTAAMAKGDMALVTTLAAKYAEADATPAEPIRTVLKETGKSYGEVWAESSLSDRRAMLGRGDFKITVRSDGHVVLDWTGDASDEMWRLAVQSGFLMMWSTAKDMVALAV